MVGRYQYFMVGFTFFDTISHLSVDSLRGVGTFFQKQSVEVHPQLIHAAGSDWIFYVLFGLLMLIAFIRFFYPAAISAVFSWFSEGGFRKSDDNFGKQGLLVPSFLMLNFIVSVILLIIVIQVKTGVRLDDISSSPQFWFVALGGVVGIFLYYQVSAFLIGFFFNTGSQASMQMKNNSEWAYVSGLVLTPLLLVYFYSGSAFVFDVMVGGLIIVLLFKWFQTVKIGLSANNFNVLHLFLYLCAVEIIPLFLLVKVYMI